MQRRTCGVYAAGIALARWIKKVVVDVTVEYLAPVAAPGKTNLIAVVIKSPFVEAHHHHDIPSDAGEPAVECDHPVVVMDVEDVDPLAAQRGLISS